MSTAAATNNVTGKRKLVLPPAPGMRNYVKPRDIVKLSGYYLGNIPDQKGKPGHHTRTSEGDVIINSATKLDEYFLQIQVGDYFTITRPEPAVLKLKNGNTLFLFDVEVDETVPPMPDAPVASAPTVAPAPRKPSASLSKVK